MGYLLYVVYFSWKLRFNSISNLRVERTIWKGDNAWKHTDATGCWIFPVTFRVEKYPTMIFLCAPACVCNWLWINMLVVMFRSVVSCRKRKLFYIIPNFHCHRVQHFFLLWYLYMDLNLWCSRGFLTAERISPVQVLHRYSDVDLDCMCSFKLIWALVLKLGLHLFRCVCFCTR